MSSSYSISFHGLSISSSLLSFSATSRLLSFAGDCSRGRSEVTYGKSSACLTILFNMDLIILHHFIDQKLFTRFVCFFKGTLLFETPIFNLKNFPIPVTSLSLFPRFYYPP